MARLTRARGTLFALHTERRAPGPRTGGPLHTFKVLPRREDGKEPKTRSLLLVLVPRAEGLALREGVAPLPLQPELGIAVGEIEPGLGVLGR